uniref:Zf-RVT domain-containing protein n=1 Tax=Haemonchus contortus TaxID=6289 RepID=A0A7I5ECY9_HAECO
MPSWTDLYIQRGYELWQCNLPCCRSVYLNWRRNNHQQLEPLRLQPGQLLLLLPEPPQLTTYETLYHHHRPQGPPLPLGVSLPALQRLLVGQP